MTTLLLRLVGPLQSWGTQSRFAVRATDRQPSKSGIIGLLAAAQGRRRNDPIEDLASLKIAVRTDQPGRVLRDFHTAKTRDGKQSMPLSQRFYLEDAVFVVAVEGDDSLIQGLAEAVANPYFPLFLGRKSCIPAAPLLIGTSQLPAVQALKDAAWQASAQYRRSAAETVRLEILADSTESSEVFVQDYPVSFSQENREYRLRPVQYSEVLVDNPLSAASRRTFVNPVESRVKLDTHDPMEGL